MNSKELDVADIITIHKTIVTKYNLDEGHCNRGQLESLLFKISFLKSASIYKKSALLLEGLIKLHTFTDGNKRTALQTVEQYLNDNGHVIFYPANTAEFVCNIASEQKNDPENIDKLIENIEYWLRNSTQSSNQA
jgi:death-on-curing protein